jgi:hypothetical protein
MRKLTALLCAVTLALVAAGCGSSGGSDGSGDDPTTTEAKATTTTKADSGDEGDEGGTDDAPADGTAQEYTAAFVTALSSGKAEDGDLVLPKAAAECVAPKWVDIMTLDLLHSSGTTVEDASDTSFDPADVGMDDGQASELVASFGECDFDIYAELALALSAGLGEDVQQCVSENVDPKLGEALLVKTFSTGESDAEFEAFLGALDKVCDLPDA